MYKAFCDLCDKELDLKKGSQMDIPSYFGGKLGDLSVVILIRELKPKGEECKNFQFCFLCMENIVDRALTENFPLDKEDEDGEETKSKVARVSPEWEGP